LLQASPAGHAFEIQDGFYAGYEFRIIGKPEDDVLTLLGRLVEKMRHVLAVKDLTINGNQFQIRAAPATGDYIWCIRTQSAGRRLNRSKYINKSGFVYVS
jgi:hypothetical protein